MEETLKRLESWMARAESETCDGCPAFEWVILGQDHCRLGFEIDQDHPVTPCIRPMTVGASFKIAQELGRPEPMVGKLDKKTYERYLAEKEAAGC